MAGLPVKLSSNPGAVRRPPPLLGEHSAQILLEMGMGAEDIKALSRQGVIATPNQ
jgi:crotonobetainyl-CoA:carnitine CoA-transferase CaiB-like acyl-CoA transferase